MSGGQTGPPFRFLGAKRQKRRIANRGSGTPSPESPRLRQVFSDFCITSTQRWDCGCSKELFLAYKSKTPKRQNTSNPCRLQHLSTLHYGDEAAREQNSWKSRMIILCWFLQRQWKETLTFRPHIEAEVVEKQDMTRRPRGSPTTRRRGPTGQLHAGSAEVPCACDSWPKPKPTCIVEDNTCC